MYLDIYIVIFNREGAHYLTSVFHKAKVPCSGHYAIFGKSLFCQNWRPLLNTLDTLDSVDAGSLCCFQVNVFPQYIITSPATVQHPYSSALWAVGDGSSLTEL